LSEPLSRSDLRGLTGLTDVFTTLIAREHVQYGKPDPEIFIIAAQQLKQPVQRCMVLEDSYNGVLGAFRAGASVVYIPSNACEQEAEKLSTGKLEDLTQLTELIERKYSG
jgi:beta-phosphoglucomutase-like phosphatase (HAD superfamily)